MSSERWARLSDSFDELCDLSAEQRELRLAELARQEPDFAADLRGMLAADANAGDLLERDSVGRAAASLVQISVGTRLGPYEILGLLGAGGMGEVYRARDTRLDRLVAVKVLPSGRAASEEMRQRLEREARAISKLQHPHICALFDVGREGDVDFLVMELLDGESLAERLAKGPLPLDQVVRYGREIAQALDYAHRNGVIHRDLKPGNVMLTRSGAKLLDFGLARSGVGRSDSTRQSVLAKQVTQARPLTAEGTLLGTFQYMSPEQLEGGESDARSDLFAFGALLYEMATGNKAFEGKSHASLIAAILASEPPPISAVQALTPPALDRLVKICLAKNPEERWQSAHDVATQLSWIGEAGSQAGMPAPLVARRRSRERWAWGAAGLFAAVALAFAWTYLAVSDEQDPLPPLHAILPLPEGARYRLAAMPELSPDGRTIAWSGLMPEDQPPLWVRSLDSEIARPLLGTEGAYLAFWSPDSRSLGFFAGRHLKRIDLAGGTPVTLCAVTDEARGGSWSPDGRIVFAGSRTGGLSSVPASGGTPEPFTELDSARGDETHRWPHFLPDGRHLLYTVQRGSPVERILLVRPIAGGAERELRRGSMNVVYASGHLLFVEESALFAQPFDAAAARDVGPPTKLLEGVAAGFQIGRAAFSASRNGHLVYLVAVGKPRTQLAWLDRAGKRSAAFDENLYMWPVRLSPDGRTAAIGIDDPNGIIDEIWTIDLAQGVRKRLSFGPGDSWAPIWSPDGKEVAYCLDRGGPGLFVRTASGRGEERRIENAGCNLLSSWSADGKLLFDSRWSGEAGKNHDIWMIPLDSPEKESPYLQTAADEGDARISPDGRYVAYMSNETGRNEIYVATLPFGAGKWQISQEGGEGPRWRADGRELFFGSSLRLFAVPILDSVEFSPGTPRQLFAVSGPAHDYEVAPEGDRFLALMMVEGEGPPPQRVLVNWPGTMPRASR